jgi:prepilin-type N-terminal cleavage/methylation domain-containing protein
MKTYLKKGFTVVEVMVAVVIVALLAAMAIPACERINNPQRRFDIITERLQNGRSITNDDIEFYNKNFKELSKSKESIALEEARKKANSLKKVESE